MRDIASKNATPSLEILIDAIIEGDESLQRHLLKEQLSLATASFRDGAKRLSTAPYFYDEIKRYLYAGDTALHFAAAAFQIKAIELLLRANADCRAENRLRSQPLHAAAAGRVGDPKWKPDVQFRAIQVLVEAGADPNDFNGNGATPLHIAVRTRSAAAVKALLACGADNKLPNKNGSLPILLAQQNTGKSGSGSAEAKLQQAEILLLLNA